MSDLIERLRSVPKVWAGHVMHEDGIVPADGRIVHEAADEIERLTAALQYEQHRAGRQGTHGEGCADWGPAHYECAIRERDELRNVLLRNGFVPCDIPACNCGSWHHRYGLPERMQEIKDALAEAGHELSNANGNLTLNALKELVAELDALKADAERYRYLKREAMTMNAEVLDECDSSDHIIYVMSVDTKVKRVPVVYHGASIPDLDALIDAEIASEGRR